MDGLNGNDCNLDTILVEVWIDLFEAACADDTVS